MSRKKTKTFKRFKESLNKQKYLNLSETGLNIKLMGKNEKFIQIMGYPQYYISNYGRIISHKRSKYTMLSPQLNGTGYFQYTLRDGNKNGEQIAAHRLVAGHFCKGFNADFQNEVHHKDHNKLNNYYKNLIWVDKTLHSFLDRNYELFFMNNYINSDFAPITDLKEVANKMGIDVRLIGVVLKGKPTQVINNMEIFEFDSGSTYPYLIAVVKPAKHEELQTA